MEGVDLLRGVDLPPGLPKFSVCEMADLLSLSPYCSTLTVEMLKLPFRCTGRSGGQWYARDLWSIGGGRSATFGVVVFNGSMVNWGVDLPLELPI